MNILFASSEAVPFCKTGGLADVVGALAGALKAKRHSVILFLPFYRQVRQQFPEIKPMNRTVAIPMGGGQEMVRLWEFRSRLGVRAIFIDSPLFDRAGGLYGETPSSAYGDNDRRFALFARAALEGARAIAFKPEIIHCHDWQTGLVSAYLRAFYKHDPFFSSAGTLFTIHNMAYQGLFPATSFPMTGLPSHAYHPDELEFYGRMSYLKSGLIYSDAINTVSPTYAKEISSSVEFGCGMEGVLQHRKRVFSGILNGIDTKIWDPLNDDYTAQRFNKTTLAKRALCKADLQKTVGLPVDARIPVLGFIGRLDYQKGVDLMVEAASSVLKNGVQLVSLGQGNPQYLDALKDLRHRFPSQVALETAFAEPLAHKIYAGADLFLMPSRFEPCGLSQMIAMRYGAVPVVTPTGGLLDTVVSEPVSKKTGFVANHVNSGAFLSAIVQALQNLKDETAWHTVQRRGMTKDFSWKTSINGYLGLYDSIRK